jgi:molecular chaperone GrpE (heat shock protein)
MNVPATMMAIWNILRGRPTAAETAIQEHSVQLGRQLAEIQLDLMHTNDQLERCRSRLVELEGLLGQAVSSGADDLLRDLASPVSQLRTQAAMLESGADVTGRSVMALARQVISRLESAGLEPIGSVGEQCVFDPETCEALRAEDAMNPGEPAVIRFVGYRCGDGVVRRALVERSNES